MRQKAKAVIFELSDGGYEACDLLFLFALWQLVRLYYTERSLSSSCSVVSRCSHGPQFNRYFRTRGCTGETICLLLV